MQELNLRSTILGGYRKNDVIQCLENIQTEFVTYKEELDAKHQVTQKEYEDLNEQYQKILEENHKLKNECQVYNADKQALIQLEIEANARINQKLKVATSKAEQLVSNARAEAEQLVDAARAEAATLREQYIQKSRQDMEEIRKVQFELDELVAMISTKNSTVQQRMIALEEALEGK